MSILLLWLYVKCKRVHPDEMMACVHIVFLSDDSELIAYASHSLLSHIFHQRNVLQTMKTSIRAIKNPICFISAVKLRCLK